MRESKRKRWKKRERELACVSFLDDEADERREIPAKECAKTAS